MFLAVDIGNSNVKLGLHDGAGWREVFRVDSKAYSTVEYFNNQIHGFLIHAQLAPDEISQIVASCVVPRLRVVLDQVFKDLFLIQPMWVGPDIYPSLNVTIPKPNEIGTDLVANVVATHHLYCKDSVIIDFGTALTFTTLTGKGEILGVSIAPGLKTAVRALFMNAAQLPEVPLEYPDSVIGKDTIHAIQSGILVGYVGLVRHKIEAIRAEVGEGFMTVATGGLSTILPPLENDFDVVNRELTLEGLRVIGQTTI